MSSLKVKTPPSGESSPEQERREAEIFALAAAFAASHGIKGPWTLDDLSEYMKVIHPASRGKAFAKGHFIQDPATGLMQGSEPGPGHEGGGGEAAGTSGGGEGKKLAGWSDFAKDQVGLDYDTNGNPEKQKKFVDLWNARIAEAPAEFRKEFLGGLNATMGVEFDDSENKLTLNGVLKSANDNRLGSYTRSIDFQRNTAGSDYFVLTGSAQRAGLGKTMLAANVAMYKKLGLDEVEVHANVDVGGYAWARYGYVPTDQSWRGVSSDIRDKIDQMAGTSGSYRASSWEELGTDQQMHIETAWMDRTESEFYDSEVSSWQDGGQPLEDAKNKLVEDFESDREWAEHAIDSYVQQRAKDGKSEMPFTNEQILGAIDVSFQSRYQDGRGDVDVAFNDELLKEPKGFESGQMTLPGLPPVRPHEMLTEEMRTGVTKALRNAFDNAAERAAGDAEPPDHLRDSAREFQGEMWGQMEDSEKYAWAERNAEQYLGGEEAATGTGEMSTEDADALRALTDSDDPKAIWAIADSKWGKDLLLHSDWNGTLDLKDKQTMDRFNAYVRPKAKAA